MADSDRVYKISLLKNVRFLTFISALVVLFFVNLTCYQFSIGNEYNFVFLIVSVILIVVICYTIFKIQAVRGMQITIHEDSIEYKRTKYENEIIYFRNIKGIGYFKKHKDDESHFGFFDGLYIYDGSSDRYCFIGISFNDYREIYKIIKERCQKTNINWQNIERNKLALVDELRDLYVS